MNRVLITAQVVERGALRYTPAGLPALDVRLAHTETVTHDTGSRQVSFEMHATAIGDLVTALQGMAVGDAADFAGYLTKQRNGRGVMLQLTELVLYPTDRTPN